MDIDLRLFANLTEYLPPGAEGRQARIAVPEGTTVAEVLDRLGIPRTLAKLIMIDGIHQPPDTVLRAGNVLSIFPPLAGG